MVMKNKSAEDSQEITLPELGEGVTEGELVKWLVSEGDSVQIDQPVAEVMTDKASMEVPSPFDGIVESFSAREGETVQVGQRLLMIKSLDKETSSKEENKEENISKLSVSEQSVRPVLKSIHPVKPLSADPKLQSMDEDISAEDSSVLATPFTRRLARELGVNLSQIVGSGLSGRVTKEDVLKYSGRSSAGTLNDVPYFSSDTVDRGGADRARESDTNYGFFIPAKDRQERRPLKGVRKKIAEKMQASKVVIPHFTLLESAEVERLDQLKNSVKDMLKERNIKVTYLSFVMKCLLQAVREFPELNAGIDDFAKEIVIKKYYNFGFAVDTPRGLLVPVIKNVDEKSLVELSFEIQTLAEKARAGSISPEEMSEGTVTITNIGSLGGEYATPIINAPESAILGMYRIYVKPCWDGSAFIPKKTMNFSLTCDHRLIDGAVSARALKFFIQKIENPLSLFI